MRLSVSVIQFTSRAHLVRCLDALVAQHGTRPEVLVPHDDSLDDVAGLRARFPDASFLYLPGRRTPGELRSAAAHAAAGDLMAFLEDHCVPAADWTQKLVAAHENGDDTRAAVGGAVEKGFPPGMRGDTALNWAVYMADYSRYMNPQTAGPAHSLTDCNVSYKREALESVREAWATEFHENIVNGLLAERGLTLWLAPDVVVHEQRTLALRSALRDRWSFGRLFASTRVAGAPIGRRLAYAAGSLIMPPVLVSRVARHLFGRGRHRTQFFRALPALLLVTSTWMLGECVGYLTASAGTTLQPSVSHNDGEAGATPAASASGAMHAR
jgi:hypothetical protein